MIAPAVHQFHPIAAPGDAVTNGMFLTRSLLRGLGFQSNIYAQHIDPALGGEILEHGRLRPSRTAALLVHHSHGHELEPWLRELRVRQFLVYHNVTPSRFFAPGSPHHHFSVRGRDMLTRFRAWMHAALCDSEHNASELRTLGYRDLVTLPLLFDIDAIRNAPAVAPVSLGSPNAFHLLFVGRVVANKCQHDLLRIGWYLKQLLDRPLRLVLVGGYHKDEPYARHLADLIHRLDLSEEVLLTGHVPSEVLYGWYRRADAFACMSEHEGFGVPLVEAMAFDRPVIAFRSSNVADTLGAGGVLVERKDHARIAAAIKVMHEDAVVQDSLRRGREQRLIEFSPRKLEAGLSAFLADRGIAVPRPSVVRAA